MDTKLQPSYVSPKSFRKSTLAVMVMAASTGTLAQQAQEEVDEQVVVQGIRANIADAAELKRSADTHIDAISAADIGSLPDASVLEAVQRIPGISIERFAAADDPDHFSVEGSGLTLRGLPQTRSEFNGRDSFSANSGRGLTFQDVSPELMGAVEVIKNHTADMIEGGISGTVNLNTRKPFDSGERDAAFSYTANYSDYRHDGISGYTPAISGLLSDVWEFEAGKFGALVSFADASYEFRTDGFEAGLWEPRDVDIDGSTATRWVPRSAGVRTTDINRDRSAASVVLQFENAAETFDTTFEYFSSESTQDWQEVAFARDEGVLVQTDDGEYDDIALVRGTLLATSSLLGNPQDGTRSQMRRSNRESEVEDISINMNWQATDALKLSFDVQRIESETYHVDLSVFGTTTADAYVDFSGDIADVQYRAPGVDPADAEAQRAYFTDPRNYYHQAAMDHLEDSEADETAFQFDALYDVDNDFIDSVQSGVRFAERNQTTRWSTYNWAELSEGWHGDGRRVYLDGLADASAWDGELSGDTLAGIPEAHLQDPGEFFRGRSDSGIAGGAWLAPNSSFVSSYDNYLDTIGMFPSEHRSLGNRDGDIVDDYYLPVEVNPVTEENTAFYVRVNFSNGDDSLIGNFGLRYVSQDVTTQGGIAYPSWSDNEIAAVLAGNDLTDFGYTAEQVADIEQAFNFATPDDIAFGNAAVDTRDAEASVSKVLPSLNLRYEMNDDMYVRFAASQSIAFPEMGLLRYNYPIQYADTTSLPDLTVDPDSGEEPEVVGVIYSDLEANSGNPFLEPMESNNFDLSWEWYFGEGNSLAAGVFYKDIKNFFASSAGPISFTNNGVTRDVEVYGPVNSGDGRLKGFEFAYNHFWDSGFGVQFNYTYLKDENIPNQNTRPVEVDDGSRTAQAFENLPLQGLSEDTLNLAAIYERGGVRARLAYNYRSDYMLTQRQVNLGVPVFSESVEMLDGSLFYEVSDNIEVGLTVNNILDEVTQTNAQVDQEGLKLPRSYFVNDRRFGLVFKLHL